MIYIICVVHAHANVGTHFCAHARGEHMEQQVSFMIGTHLIAPGKTLAEQTSCCLDYSGLWSKRLKSTASFSSVGAPGMYSNA